jgi:MATE family multidrug resistance protein
VGRIGDIEMQAVTATFAINHLAFMPMIGFGIATSVLVGQFVGAERVDLARRATRHAFEMTFAYMVAIAAVYVLFPEPLVRLFGNREASGMAAVVAYSVVLLRFVALYSVFDTGNIIYASALRGAGDTLYVVVMMAVLSVGLMVVPSWLVVEVFHLGLYWAMAGPTVYVIVLAGAFYLRYRTGRWEHMRVIEQASVSPDGADPS